MIVRIFSGGKSFKGLSDYLMHDPKAQSDERVAWTHTLNLANDHVPSAVDEMLWTARDAELLKQEAGIRAGGRATESPVKHISLNWSPEETPTREHMIETTESFLRHMQWEAHQAILVAHDDKAHAHVHIQLNKINPATGLNLNDDFERRRAQAWALDYEREDGMVYCGQRLQRPGEREDAPTRDAWTAFQENQKTFERTENHRREFANLNTAALENPKNAFSNEWKFLKEFQRDERQDFFAEGKSAFSQMRLGVYQEVRGEFRERWSDYYAARRDGADNDVLAGLKANLLAEQRGVLGARRDDACAELRETRDGIYRQLLGDQRDDRHELRYLQEAGHDRAAFFQGLKRHDFDFREAATAITARQEIAVPEAGPESEPASASTSMTHAGADLGAHAIGSLGAGAFSLFTGWFVELNYGSGQKPERAAQTTSDLFTAAADEAQKRQQQEAREEADQAWRDRERTRVWD